jgi:hypothetical protein
MSNQHSGFFWIKVAERNDLPVKYGGKHAKVYAPAGRGYQTIPLHSTLSKGVECAVRKWFKQLGIVIAIILAILGSLAYQYIALAGG